MLGLRESKKKAKDMLSDAISYADELVHDERMRSDLCSALDHGLAASERLREDSGIVGFSERLESDTKLRKSIRSMLEDLDSAAHRARHRTSHRARNTILVLGGAGMAVVSVVRGRRWIEAHWSMGSNGTSPSQASTVPLVF
jgi:hypothetical protein